MSQRLIVVRPFAAYRHGDPITDPAEIARILGSELAAFVVRVATPPAATPAAKES